MSVVAYRSENARQLRRRLFDPPNAVVDRPLEMRNGRTVTAEVLYIEKQPLPVCPQAGDKHETLLPANRHLNRAHFRGAAVPGRAITVSLILEMVAERYGKTVNDLVSVRKTKDVILFRQIACYLARNMTPMSLPMIGRKIGDRDHSTILHAVNKVTRLIDRDPEFAAEIYELRRRISKA